MDPLYVGKERQEPSLCMMGAKSGIKRAHRKERRDLKKGSQIRKEKTM